MILLQMLDMIPKATETSQQRPDSAVTSKESVTVREHHPLRSFYLF
jgi:hypothetical protein